MIFSSISHLWNEWNIRGFIMLSLLLQIFLILFAPCRKKTTDNCIISILWLAYLMADWVVVFGIGLISHNQGNPCARAIEVDGALQAFWASFFLLHLGGPDSITAFSWEDSSLWKRHLFSLTFQVVAAINVFVHIFSNHKLLVYPTILVFLAAIIKNAERTLALFLSNLPELKKGMLPMITIDDAIIHNDETDIRLAEHYAIGYDHPDKEEMKLPEIVVVEHARSFLQIFKVFIGDLMFTEKQRKMSRDYFFQVSAVDALRVISVELHLIYEMLYTKAILTRSIFTKRKKVSYIFRFIACTNIVIALVLFNRLKKHRLLGLDVKITYTLLFGAITLDVIALFMLVFSGVTFSRIKQGSFFHKLVSVFQDLRKPRFATYEASPNAEDYYTFLDTPFIFRRWSESISACNIFSMLILQSPRKMYERVPCWGIVAFSFSVVEKIIFYFYNVVLTIGTRSGLLAWRLMISNTRHVSKNPLVKKLWVFIFEEVKRKATDAETLEQVKVVVDARGVLSLERSLGQIEGDILISSVTEANFDLSVITWHIATEMLYNKEKKPTVPNEKKEFSRILSDYMLYLFLNQSNVMSVVLGVAHIRTSAILVQLRRFFDQAPKDVEEICSRLSMDDVRVREDPLRKGINLAKEIEMLGDKKWDVMSGVWVEILSYAAVHIKGEAHVQVLSKGGELLTFVWLLMAHFGCIYKPEVGIYFEP